MRVRVILKRWIEVLAALLLSCHEAWRSRRSLIVCHDADGLRIRQVGAGTAREEKIWTIPTGTPVPKEVAQIVHKGLIVLELPSEKITVRRISVPAKAREFLPGVIRNLIDRLSPWQTDHAVYGFDAKANPDDPTALDVVVAVTSRAIVDAAREEVATVGLVVDRIIVRETTGDAAAPVALWSRVADAPRVGAERAHRLIGMAIAGCVALSFAVSVAAVTSAASLRNSSDDAESRSETLQRQLHVTRNAAVNASLDPAESAWLAKQSTPSAVVSLEALSRALPDTSYLTDLQFEHDTIRIIGLAADAPSLVAPLERSGHFTGVHFFAPTTRDPDATLYRFHIEAQVEPQLRLDQD